MQGGGRATNTGHRRRFTRRLSIASLLIVPVLIAGCATGDDSSAAGGGGTAAAPSDHYPVTVENCGRTLIFDEAPSRVYLGYQSAAELFFGLGLADRAIAQIAPADPPLPEQAADFERVPDRSPDSYVPVGREEMLQLRPDLLFAYVNSEYGGPDVLAPGLATIDDLAIIGANVYALVCPGEEPVRVDFTYRAIRDLGVIFDVEDRANAVAEQLEARVADVQRRVAGREPKPVLFYYGGEGPLMTGTSISFMDEMIRLAGGTNVFGDIAGGRRGFLDVSQEQVATKDPYAFMIVATPSSPQDAEAKAEYLYRTFPQMQASVDRRLVLTTDTSDTPGWRYVSVIENLARALHPDAFADAPPTSTGTG